MQSAAQLRHKLRIRRRRWTSGVARTLQVFLLDRAEKHPLQIGDVKPTDGLAAVAHGPAEKEPGDFFQRPERALAALQGKTDAERDLPGLGKGQSVERGLPFFANLGPKTGAMRRIFSAIRSPEFP